MREDPHLLVVANPQVEAHYVQLLSTLGAACHVISTLDDLGRTPPHSEFHGMVVDIHSFFKLQRSDRAFIKEHSSIIPTLKFFMNPKGFLVVNKTTLQDNQVHGIEEFVGKCATLKARVIRKTKRYKICLNVKLEDYLTNTLDVSKSGCFIFIADESYKVGQDIFVYFNELSDKTAIQCKIMRRVDWGNKYLAAGIGVDFVSMTESQRIQLGSILSEYNERNMACK
jgi:Tfp pilus assembly protein PilZ